MPSGRVVVITGATQNTGLTMSEHFARQGDIVVVNGRREAAVAEVVAAISAQGGTAVAGVGDVSDPVAVRALFDEVVRSLGRVDVLIHSATSRHHAPIAAITDEQWADVLATTLTGGFLCARAVVPHMVAAESGRILFIGGHSAQSGIAGGVATTAAKAGLMGMTKSLAREVAASGVTVNCVSPGYVRTDRDGDSDARAGGRVPMGRFGTQQEIADTAWFLAGPGAAYITGQVISVNGGVYT